MQQRCPGICFDVAAIKADATDDYQNRHTSVPLSLQSPPEREGPGGCSAKTDLFPDTGYVSRRTLYLTRAGPVYVLGRFDARVVDAGRCTVTRAEFRHLDRDDIFLGRLDGEEQGRWSFLPVSQRHELPFEKL